MLPLRWFSSHRSRRRGRRESHKRVVPYCESVSSH
ncbi:hypothetical protein LINPERHAP1_LOCUS11845 [Linum perenne]